MQLALELAIQAFETYRFNVKRPHMRSLFHFPFPAQPPSQQPSHCSQKCAIARILHPCAASAAPQFCFPPPARSPVPGWQESHRMHPFFAECAKKAPFLATSARNACFSRSRWQHPRPMHPFPGAIGRFGIHGARILPPRALFRVGEPEITHGAKMLPAPRGLSAAAACGPRTDASRYLRAAPIPPAARTHRVQETSGTTQITQCGHKNRIPKWGPY